MTTVTAWCRATAVVCSGRKRPQDSNGQWEATPRERRAAKVDADQPKTTLPYQDTQSRRGNGI
jgi:hypothetical protein